MNEETKTLGQDEQPNTETTMLPIVTGLSYFCPQCGAKSDGFTQCLHTRDSAGKETIRCVSCYRAYVQSEEHLAKIHEVIPELILEAKSDGKA